jgi:hypothetical protein
MGSKHLGVDHDLTLAIKNELGIDTFIESGTWKGGTSLWAAEHFDEVITIEGYPARFYKTWRGFRHSAPNIMFLLGDSRTLMPALMTFLQVPAIFWLDAHYCTSNEQEADAGLDKCPIMYELMAINKHKLAYLHPIMIDDVRMFGNEGGWPRREVVMSELCQFNRRVIEFEDVWYALPEGCSVYIPEGV